MTLVNIRNNYHFVRLTVGYDWPLVIMPTEQRRILNIAYNRLYYTGIGCQKTFKSASSRLNRPYICIHYIFYASVDNKFSDSGIVVNLALLENYDKTTLVGQFETASLKCVFF